MPRPRKPIRLATDPHGTFYVLWHDGRRDRRTSTRTRSRDEAEAFLREFLTHRRPEPGPVMAVGDVLTLYADERATQHAAPQTTAIAITHLARHLGAHLTADLGPRTAADYAAARRAERPGLRDTTLRRELGVLTAALRHAQKRHGLAPVAPPDLPPQGRGRDRWLTPDEAQALLAHAAPHVRLFILLALHTGARSAALLGLTWGQVDLPGRRIDLNPPGRRQTAKRRPVVPISDALATVLASCPPGRPDAPVVAFRGRALGRIVRGFAAAAQAAGLAGVTPHVLRHTAGTWAAQAGRPLHEIAGLLGHSTARTTELYAHHHPDYIRAATDAIAARLGPAPTTAPPPRKRRPPG